MQKHFEPPINVILEHFYFHHWNQGNVESVKEYLTELHQLATNCQFADYLEHAL